MARTVNPNDEQWNSRGPKAAETKEGRKLLVGVGFERYTAGTGSRMLMVRFLCLADLDGGPDAKSVHFENYTLEDKSLWVFMNYVKATGYSEAMDLDNDEHISAVLCAGYVEATIEKEKRPRAGSAPKLRIGAYSYEPPGPNSPEDDPEWQTWISEAEEGHQKYLEWRERNPRGAARSGGSGRASSGAGGGYGGGYGGGEEGGRPQGGGPDEDIPFREPVAA